MSETQDLSASIRGRLLNIARAGNRPYNEILQYYAMERFLYRLSCSSHSRKLILKGGLLFRAWGTSPFRPTRDIDFSGSMVNKAGAVTRVFQEICTQEVEPDGLIFEASSVHSEQIQEEAEYQGVRISLKAYLGKGVIRLQIDIGFADVISPRPVALKYPTLLQMPEPRLRGYPPESVVAEKFQAMVFLGSINSRMKDYYDLWVMAEQFEFDGRTLQQAVMNTFQRRNTALPEALPIGLSDSFAAQNQVQWQAFIKRSQVELAPQSIFDLLSILNNLLVPLMRASSAGSAFSGRWKPGGPWELP